MRWFLGLALVLCALPAGASAAPGQNRDQPRADGARGSSETSARRGSDARRDTRRTDDLEQVQRVVGLAERGQRIQARLAELDEAIGIGEASAKRTRAQLLDARRRLDATVAALRAAEAEFTVSLERLNTATVEYVTLTGELGSRSQASDENVLDYLADADVQDAVLVYQTASSLLESKARRLDSLRTAAQRQSVARQRLGALRVNQRELIQRRSEGLDRLRAQLDELTGAYRTSRRDLTAYRRIERRYAKRIFAATGQRDPLTALELTDGQRTDARAPGPLRWPVSGTISSSFQRNRCLAGVCRPHEGIDISVPSGTPVRASADGRVSTAGPVSGYGNFVCVRHTASMETCNAHLSSIAVEVNQAVRAGQVVGVSGCTGRCFGPHVHFELRQNDAAVDPAPHLPQ